MLRAARAAALLAAARAEGGAAASTSGSSGSSSFSSSFGSSSERRGAGMLFFFARSLASTPAPAPAVDGIECTVNGKTVTIPKGANVMAACDAAGVDIPRYGGEGRGERGANIAASSSPIESTKKINDASFFVRLATALALAFLSSSLAPGQTCSCVLWTRMGIRAREFLEHGEKAA